jgi:hypothetical protein
MSWGSQRRLTQARASSLSLEGREGERGEEESKDRKGGREGGRGREGEQGGEGRREGKQKEELIMNNLSQKSGAYLDTSTQHPRPTSRTDTRATKKSNTEWTHHSAERERDRVRRKG